MTLIVTLFAELFTSKLNGLSFFIKLVLLFSSQLIEIEKATLFDTNLMTDLLPVAVLLVIQF